MSNMSYCRFENTLRDLRDCQRAMNGEDSYFQCKGDLSEEEFRSMIRLIQVCGEIIEAHECSLNVLEQEGTPDAEEPN